MKIDWQQPLFNTENSDRIDYFVRQGTKVNYIFDPSGLKAVTIETSKDNYETTKTHFDNHIRDWEKEGYVVTLKLTD